MFILKFQNLFRGTGKESNEWHTIQKLTFISKETRPADTALSIQWQNNVKNVKIIFNNNNDK